MDYDPLKVNPEAKKGYTTREVAMYVASKVRWIGKLPLTGELTPETAMSDIKKRSKGELRTVDIQHKYKTSTNRKVVSDAAFFGTVACNGKQNYLTENMEYNGTMQFTPDLDLDYPYYLESFLSVDEQGDVIRCKDLTLNKLFGNYKLDGVSIVGEKFGRLF